MVDKDGNDIDCPLHPNCGCTLRPHLKTDEDILKAFKEEMAEELGIIEGTQEQKDMLADIDKQLELAQDETLKSPINFGKDDEELSFIKAGEIVSSSLRQHEPPIAKALKIEDKIRSFSNEAAFIIDEDGNSVFENLWGNNDKVTISKSRINRNTITHNHISGGTLSGDDVAIFALHSAKEFRACTPSGITFSIRIGEDEIDKRLAKAYLLYEEKTNREANLYAKLNSKTEDEYNAIRSGIVKEKLNTWLVENAKEYSYIYTIEKREK
jgi:hypothetical protein